MKKPEENSPEKQENSVKTRKTLKGSDNSDGLEPWRKTGKTVKKKPRKTHQNQENLWEKQCLLTNPMKKKIIYKIKYEK